jgi:peptide/nickel transport system substrate-binding protein
VTEINKEFRLKSGNTILEYIRRFSSTEKFVFAILGLTALVSALVMSYQANNLFLVEVPAHGGELREGLVGLPRTINPILAITDIDRDISSLVYSGLTKYDGGNIVSDLAKSYTISPDGLTYDFILKDDVKFQDGMPVTSEDIAFTIQKIQDSSLKSPRRADWASVTTKVISPTDIQFVLKQPYSPFISNTTVGILPKHIWGNVSTDQFIFSDYNIRPLGSGPYKVDEIVRDSGGIPTVLRLTTWGKYYAKEPYVEYISFNFYADQEKALQALDSGSIDSLPSISPISGARLSSDSAQNYTVMSSALPRIFGVFFNQNKSSVLADKVVRQALDMSVDRNAIVNDVLGGYGLSISGPFPYGLYTSTSSQTVFDQGAAMALLEKNGWLKGDDGIYAKKATKKTAGAVLSFELYTVNSQELKQIAQLLIQSWAKIGVKVELKTLEANDLYQNIIKTRTYDAILFGGQIGKERDLYAFWHSSQRNAPGLNVSMYTNSKADKLLEDIRKTSDATSSNKMFAQFADMIKADIPAIFIYSPDFIYAVPKSLNNIKLDSLNTPSDRFNSISNWYISTDKVWSIFTKFDL